jgi:hypothetical protein
MIKCSHTTFTGVGTFPHNGLRLVALVVLHLHTLKQNILPGHQDYQVQHQFSRTCHPLYLLLHINQHLRAPRVILFFFLPSPSLSILSPPPTRRLLSYLGNGGSCTLHLLPSPPPLAADDGAYTARGGGGLAARPAALQALALPVSSLPCRGAPASSRRS